MHARHGPTAGARRASPPVWARIASVLQGTVSRAAGHATTAP